jgi:hypothetical protein
MARSCAAARRVAASAAAARRQRHGAARASEAGRWRGDRKRSTSQASPIKSPSHTHTPAPPAPPASPAPTQRPCPLQSGSDRHHPAPAPPAPAPGAWQPSSPPPTGRGGLGGRGGGVSCAAAATATTREALSPVGRPTTSATATCASYRPGGSAGRCTRRPFGLSTCARPAPLSHYRGAARFSRLAPQSASSR